MQKIARGAAPLCVLALALLSLAPAAAASTLKVDLDPSTGAATMTSVSSTHVVLAYPANSTLSKYLKGFSQSDTASGTFNAGSQGISDLVNHLHDDEGRSVSIQNMTVSTNYSAKANATALVINKDTNITATVKGVFKVVNGTVTADLGWRAFHVDGALDLDFQGHSVDINLLGSTIAWSMVGRDNGLGAVTGMFGGDGLWNMPTLNFSSLSAPLTTWTKSYNSLTNTTTFSKTISGSSSLSTTYTNDGQTYSLKVTSDPSAEIVTCGYAVASGNSLSIEPTPVYLSPVTWVAAAGVAAFTGAVAMVLVRARRARPSPAPATVTPL